jgi:cytoskeletal protein RodZ
LPVTPFNVPVPIGNEPSKNAMSPLGVVPVTVAVNVTVSPSVTEAAEAVTVVVVSVFTTPVPIAEAGSASIAGQRAKTKAVVGAHDAVAPTKAGTRKLMRKTAKKMANACFCKGLLAIKITCNSSG